MTQAKPTAELLKQLRVFMKDFKYVKEPLQAYVVPSGDAHYSEYVAACDQRRAYISGFTGSLGIAIITHDAACMWTDGRYYLQASQEMDSNWTLMKEGLPDTPSRGKWLTTYLPPGSYVGVDPKLMTYQEWIPLQSQLDSVGQKLVPVPTNLVDLVWPNKPSRPKNPVKPLSIRYTGKTIEEKLKDVRQEMRKRNAKVLVLTALDEIAWLLNLRGSDIDHDPLFFSYVIVEENSFTLFIDKGKITEDVNEHLVKEANGSFKVEAYEDIENVLEKKTKTSEGYFWLSETANYSLTSIIPQISLLTEMTPVELMKAVKNPTEKQGMRNAHVKDAAALCCFFAWLEKAINDEHITEISAAKKLESFRMQQKDYVGASFPTISSVGPHGAIIHYQPKESTDAPLSSNELYLCDSGAQYLDGTTDVTRTVHLGTPTNYQKECFTRVLKGNLQLGSLTFPKKIKGNYLDSFARKALWDVGLDYGHGTGHGIGSYLCVHEGPMAISWRYKADDPGLEASMFVSNEPGYYEDGKFGIRIEDIVEIVEAKTPYNFGGRGFLTFETITLVPKQIKMIDVDLLTQEEVDLLNTYHQQCRDIVGPLLDHQQQLEAKHWLWKETEPIKK